MDKLQKAFDKHSTDEWHNPAGIVMTQDGFNEATKEILSDFILWFNKKDWEYKTDTFLDKIISDFQIDSKIGDM